MATPNYRFAKRQRDLAKQSKQEQKREKKRARDEAAKGVPATDDPPPGGASAPEKGTEGIKTP